MIPNLAALERELASRTNYERTAPPAGGFRLDDMRALCAALNEPQRHPRVIHVAGTTGKGTTCAAIASCLDAAGQRVGLYTSPHLVDLRERIRIGRDPAPDALWLEAAREVLPVAEQVAPHATWFELVTAIGFVAFRAAQVDALVLEVGLGGRLDATNVAEASVAVITRIARDHTALLGTDERAIAAEKAGIIVPGAPVVAGPGHPEAIAVVEERAANLGAPLWLLDRDLRWRHSADALTIITPRGEHRVEVDGVEMCSARMEDLTLAAGAVDALNDSPENTTSSRSVSDGLARTRWPGRFQRVVGDPEWILDGAHDPVSAAALLETLAPNERPVLLVGAAKDKDLAALLPLLGRRCSEAFTTTIPSPRSASPTALAAILAPHLPTQPGDLSQAEARARTLNQPLLITGSLMLVGAAMRARGLDAGPIWR